MGWSVWRQEEEELRLEFLFYLVGVVLIQGRLTAHNNNLLLES